MDEAASGCWSRLVELVFGRCCCRRPAGAAVGVAAAPAPCAVNSAKRTRAPDAWFLPNSPRKSVTTQARPTSLTCTGTGTGPGT